MIMMSSVTTILFLVGWLPIINIFIMTLLPGPHERIKKFVSSFYYLFGREQHTGIVMTS